MSAPEPPPKYNQPNNDVVEAELAPASNHDEPEDRSGAQQFAGLCLIASVILFALLVVIGLAAWWIVGLVGASSDSVTKAQPTFGQKNQRWVIIEKAFSEPFCDVDEETKKQIENAIQSIMKLDQNDADAERLLARVDINAFVKRMRATGIYSPRWNDRLFIQGSFSEVTSGPLGYKEFHIVSVESLNEQNAVVSMHATDFSGDTYEVRWWMTLVRDQWNVYDWEVVMDGITAVEEYSVICARQESKGIQNYYRANDDFVAGVNSFIAGEQEKGMKKLDRSLSIRVDPALQDYFKLQNGNWMYSYYEDERAKEVLNSISNPKMTPGAWYFLAKCYSQEKDYSQSLHFSELYLDRVGCSIDMLNLKVKALESLKRNDEAVEFLKANLEFFPDRKRPLAKLFRLMPADQRPEILDLVSGGDDAASAILDAADSTWGPADWQFLKAAKEKLQNCGATEAQLAEFDAHHHYSRYQYPEASDAWLKACQLATDSEDKNNFQNQYLQIMTDRDEPIQGYLNAPDPESAFQYISDNIHDDFDITPEQSEEITDLHRSKFPNAPMLEYLVGSAYAYDKQPEKAAQAYQQGLDRIKKQSDSDSGDEDSDIDESIATYENSLNYQRTRFMEPIEAYNASSDPATTFWHLASKLELQWKNQPADRDQVAKVLKQLVDAETKNPDPSGTLLNYQAVVHWQAGEKEKAIKLLTDGIFDPDPESEGNNAATSRLAQWFYEEGTWTAILPVALTKYMAASNTDNDADEGSAEVDDDDPTRQNIVTVLNELFDNLLDDKKISEAKQLIEIHRTAGLPEFARKVWSLKIHEAQKDDAAIQELNSQITDQQWADADYNQIYQAEEIIFASLIRLKDFDNALLLGSRDSEAGPRDLVQIGIAQLAKRDIEGLESTIEEMNAEGSNWRYTNFISNPLAKDFVGDDQFRALRNRFPMFVPSHYEDSTVYYLFESKPSETALQKLLHDQWNERLKFVKLDGLQGVTPNEKTEELDPKRKPRSSFVANADGTTVILTSFSEPLTTPGDDRPKLSKIPFVVSVKRSPSDAPQLSFSRLNAGMLKLGCKAFYHQDESEFVQFTGDEKLDDDGNPATQVETSIYLYPPSSDHDDAYWKKMRRGCELLQDMIDSSGNEDGKGWEILVKFERGSAVEFAWMPLIDQDPMETPLVLTATRTQPVLLFPGLKAGEPQSVSFQDVVKWRTTGGETTE